MRELHRWAGRGGRGGHTQAPPLPGCVTLGKLLNLSVSSSLK